MKVFFANSYEFIKSTKQTIKYILSIQPMAGNFIKRFFLQKIIKKHKLTSFVETGTYYGDTTKYIELFVDKVFTIEIYKPLFERAEKRFKNNKKVDVLYGDSKNILKQIVIKEGTLFFLDGHYSGEGTGKGDKECPLIEELDIIQNLGLKKYVIIIDDFRLFGIDENYPTMTEIEKKLKDISPNSLIQIYHDMIYFVPNHSCDND